jgi:putative GTP pyrophosphokinase
MDAQEQALLHSFHELKPALVKWASYLDTTLLQIIKEQYPESGFVQMPPVHRCKSDKSLLDKAFHRDKDYVDPLRQIEDKVATRIVVVTTDNVYRVKNIITASSVWECEVAKDIRQSNESNPNLFDYQSVHLILWPKEPFEGHAPELLTCEVQIRTLLQHSYAEVTHDSVYKGPYRSDNAMKRSLAKCMALMETTDDMFCGIFNRISMTGTDGAEPNVYLQELIELYNRLLDRKITYQDLDIIFTDSVFELRNIIPVPMEDLTDYCETIVDVIKPGIEAASATIFRQPAVLLLFYYADLHRGFLESEFRLNSSTMRQILLVSNTATDY